MFWDLFKAVLQANSTIFDEKIMNNKWLFMNVYSKVCTRCHAYGNNGSVLVPMCDNFNHSCENITSTIMCLSQHAQLEKHENYKQMVSPLIDHSMIY